MQTIPNDLIRPGTAAEVLGVAVATIYKYIDRGLLPAWRRRGSRYLQVSRADVEAMLEPVAVVPRAEPVIPSARQQSARQRRTDEILASVGL